VNSTSSLEIHVKASSRFTRIFIGGRSGLRSGWRLLLFIIVLSVLELLPAIIAGHSIPRLHAWVQSQPQDTMKVVVLNSSRVL
jgi:hypothetical protein